MRNRQSNTRLWTFGAIALGVAVLVLVLGMVFSTPSASAQSSVSGLDQSPAEQAQATEQPVAKDARADSVDVTVSEGTIEVPETVTAGSTTFEVTNTATQPHSFAISGPAEASLDSELGPGQSETLTKELQPGTYEAYCPVEGHREQESAEFTVER